MSKKTLEDYLSAAYPCKLIPDREEGGYTAYYPDLPGCITCGETMKEALKNAEDAKKEWLCAALEEGIHIPEPSALKKYYQTA